MKLKGWIKVNHKYGYHSYKLILPLLDIYINHDLNGKHWNFYVNSRLIKFGEDEKELLIFADNFIIEKVKELNEVLK